MLWSAILILLVGLIVPDEATPSTTSTTLEIPDSPAAGLSLDPQAVTSPDFPPPPTLPVQASPLGSPAAVWAAIAATAAWRTARARRISVATREVRDSLQDSLFSDVNHEDLSRIARIFDTLDPMEATAVVASLSDRELGVWLRELDGWAGSFSPAEEEALFSRLVGTLAPDQLARLISMGKSHELMEATMVDGSSRVRAELAVALWSVLEPADRDWEDIAGVFESASVTDREGAVARAMSGSLLIDLLGVDVRGPDRSPRVRFDTLARFVDGAAAFEDPGLKAEIFVAANEALSGIHRMHRVGDIKPTEVLSRLGALIRTDPGPVVIQLNHRYDPHGDVMAGWVHDMIEADRLDELDVVFVDLLGSSERLAYFAEVGEDPARPYPNAANLGYYVGAYSLAIDAVADGAEDQINLVEQLFSIVTGIVPGPDNSRVLLPLSPLVDVHARSVVDGLRSEAATLKQTLWGLAKPRTAEGLFWNGPGTTQFQDAWEEVVAVR